MRKERQDGMVYQEKRKLILEDGSEYCGFGFGAPVPEGHVCELVFNTSMAGYQEILSDPSYTGQAVVMTYPLIGNYGMAPEDYETDVPTIGALIVREYNDSPSNFRSSASLGQVMEKYGIPGLWGVDTRKITRSIRNFGSRKALLTRGDMPKDEALKILASKSLLRDAVSRVSTPFVREFPVEDCRFRVAAIDCGMKWGIVRSLNRRGCSVTAFPWNASAEEVLAMHPDGVLFSNGPGNPEDVPETIQLVQKLRGKLPIFGICLGHQVIALAYGAKTYKLKFGHRGGNHPVRDLETGKIEITSQNHSYAVNLDSLKDTSLTATHINLLDSTVEGAKCDADRVFSVQYHPESAPGPQDSGKLFDRFIAMMEEEKHHA